MIQAPGPGRQISGAKNDSNLRNVARKEEAENDGFSRVLALTVLQWPAIVCFAAIYRAVSLEVTPDMFVIEQPY